MQRQRGVGLHLLGQKGAELQRSGQRGAELHLLGQKGMKLQSSGLAQAWMMSYDEMGGLEAELQDEEHVRI